MGDYIGDYIAKRCVGIVGVREPSAAKQTSPPTCKPLNLRSRINDFQPTPEKPFALGLPTGSSPIPTYKHLIRLVKDGKLS